MIECFIPEPEVRGRARIINPPLPEAEYEAIRQRALDRGDESDIVRLKAEIDRLRELLTAQGYSLEIVNVQVVDYILPEFHVEPPLQG